MEKYIINTDLINAYLNNTLSIPERQVFENRLKTDVELKQLYNEQLAILEGINRFGIKAEIDIAKQGYVRGKWMKYFGFSVGVVLILVVAFNLFLKAEDAEIVTPIKTESNEAQRDSVVVEMNSEEKKASEVIEKAEISNKIIGKKNEIAKSQKVTSNDVSSEEVIKKKPVSKTKMLVKTKEAIQKTKPEPITLELKSFFKSNKKTPQIIEVNTEKDFTVTCKEGTTLTILAKSFVDAKTGKLARGKINLEVTEYYKLSEMLLGNLTTKSDDKQLETGGMLYLNANKKGQKLKLKTGRRIQMAFNNKGKENMQLFSGEENSEGVNWKLENQIQNNLTSIKTVAIVDLIEEDVTIDFRHIEEVPIYPGCENINNTERRQCMNDAINKLVARKFNLEIAENLGLTGTQRIYSNFEIDKDGNIGKINVRAPKKELGEEAIKVLELIPQLTPGRQKGKLIKTTYNLVFTIALEGETLNSNSSVTVKSDKKFTETFEKRLDSIKSSNGLIGTISNNDIERYAFGTTQLGWINCDRFVRSKKQKVKFKLKIKDAQGANVKLIFKSVSSILPSKKFADEFDFGNIPIDEDVIVIAIKKNKDKLFLAKKETTTTKGNPNLDLDFKEVTVQQLKKELESLNESF